MKKVIAIIVLVSAVAAGYFIALPKVTKKFQAEKEALWHEMCDLQFESDCIYAMMESKTRNLERFKVELDSTISWQQGMILQKQQEIAELDSLRTARLVRFTELKAKREAFPYSWF